MTTLRRVELPAFGPGAPVDPPAIPEAEYSARADALYGAAGVDWVAVYGDREHNANLLHLSNFDPRFEEALLLLGPQGRRVLIVGIEGLGHIVERRLESEVVLAQSFGLMGQPRTDAASLVAILRAAGMKSGDRVGVVGWKYRIPAETGRPQRPAFVAAGIVDDLEEVTGTAPVDVTAVLMDPARGQRLVISAAQAAQFAWAADRASQAVFRVMRGAEPGMSERQALGQMGFEGEVFSMHPIVASASRGTAINGLRSATGRVLHEGDGISCGIGYWGSLCCRAGMLQQEVDASFMTDIVGPYYEAQAAWYEALGIGVAGGDIFDTVHRTLEATGTVVRPALNPGHLISYDEWSNTPIRDGSRDVLVSGMMIQCDIIPTPLPAGMSLNCEDTVMIADEALRGQIAREYPWMWKRAEEQRAFMQRELGIVLAPEVLPLSCGNAYLPPFWMDDTLVCSRIA